MAKAFLQEYENQIKPETETELQDRLADELNRLLRQEKSAVGGRDEKNARFHRINSVNSAIQLYQTIQGRQNDVARIPVHFPSQEHLPNYEDSSSFTPEYKQKLNDMEIALRKHGWQAHGGMYSGELTVKVASIKASQVNSFKHMSMHGFHRPAMVLSLVLEANAPQGHLTPPTDSTNIELPVEFIDFRRAFRRGLRRRSIEITSPSPAKAK